MSKKIYIGNLSFSTTEEALSEKFSVYGDVISCTIIKDKETLQSKGFGFVEMDDDVAADKAIFDLNGRELDGRKIRVSLAEEKMPRAPRSGGSFGGGGRRNGPRRDNRRSRPSTYKEDEY